MDNVSIILAFWAGLASFLSPCVLPLVPAYISYLTGASINELNKGNEKLNILYKSISFVIGFSIIFMLMGASISYFGNLFAAHQTGFRRAAGLLMIVFGLHITGLLKIKLFYREKRLLPFFEMQHNVSPIFMGMAFAAGWTPCVGPILGTILSLAATVETVNKGILLLAVYSLGLAVPFILTALVIEKFTKYFKKISKHLTLISVLSGLLMVAMGLLILTNKLNLLSQWFNFSNTI